MKEYLSVAELCEFLNVSKATIHKLSSQKKLPKFKPAGIKNIYFKYSDVVTFLENGRISSISEIEHGVMNDLSNLFNPKNRNISSVITR